MEIKRVYICSVCETVHNDEWAAEECCPPEVWEMWQCPVCEETHDTEDEALACCGCSSEDDAPSTGEHRNYPRELTSNANRYIEQFITLNRYVKE